MIRKHNKYHIFTDENNVKYTGVNKLIYKFKVEEDWDKLCEKTAAKRGVDPKALRAEWDAKAEKSKKRGVIYHEFMERKYESMNKPFIHINKKLMWDSCSFKDGHVYIEQPVWDTDKKIIGIVDYIQVKDNSINIIDYKTNEEIKFESFKDKRYLDPLSHIPDCNAFDYYLQINFYMYLSLKNNPKLKMGKMFIEHVTFDWDDNIKDTIMIPVPNYQKEINLIINHV
jgi:hypothetical protein